MAKASPYVISPDPAPGDRREARKARTRRELVDAANRLFLARGFDETTVEDIAAEAHVSPRTFFRYFATKEEVLFSDREQLVRRLEESLARRPADEPPLTVVRETLLEVMRDYQQEPKFHLLRYRLSNQTPAVEAYALHLHQHWIRVLSKAVARRLGVDPSADLRPNFIAGCATMAMRSALIPWVRSRGERDLGELTREAFELLERGLGGV